MPAMRAMPTTGPATAPAIHTFDPGLRSGGMGVGEGLLLVDEDDDEADFVAVSGILR